MLAFTTAFSTALALTLSAPSPKADSESLARHFIEQLAAHKFATAGAAFSDQMKSNMSPEKLTMLWNSLENQKGAFQKIDRVSSEPLGEGTAVLLICRFARAPVTFQIFIDAQKHIGGLLLSPASLIARRFLNLLGKGDVAGAEAMFDPKLRKELPAPKLAALWKDVEAEAGAFESLDRSKVESTSGDWASVATVRFEKTTVVFRFVVDGEARIIGFVRQ